MWGVDMDVREGGPGDRDDTATSFMKKREGQTINLI